MNGNDVEYIYDRLYGEIGFSKEELRLFQTREMARLRQVSLSAIPSWILPTGVCASRFEHSVGVSHLAKIVAEKAEFNDVAYELYIAALAHDIGTPPFSHASEVFLYELFGVGHEEFAREVVEDSEFFKEVKKQRLEIDRILSFIEGKDQPLSDIINGSIDIDNLDNSLRFGLSMGIVNQEFYKPEVLANCYRMIDGELVLLEPPKQQIFGWEIVREQVYDFVYSQMNLATGSLLFRAMELAFREGELDRKYFFMTDAEAFEYLSQKCNDRTRRVMEWANCWIFFPKIFDWSQENITKEMKSFFIDPSNRGKFADWIAQKLGIEPEQVCVYLGKNKGYKKIHLPLIEFDGKTREHHPYTVMNWRAQVYLHPKLNEKVEKAAELAREYLAMIK